MPRRKYYALLVGATVEPEVSWDAQHIIYSRLRDAKEAYNYWTDHDNFKRVSKCKIVEVKLGKTLYKGKGG